MSTVPNDPDPIVWLAFPPLVETNFGGFFPSTAVLAAYLEAHGIATEQADLNERFALRLLDPDLLDTVGAGGFPGIAVDSFTAACARWLCRQSGRLFDDRGRHDFGPSSAFGFALQSVARPFGIDPTPQMLRRIDSSDPVVASYSEFYDDLDGSGVAATIPASVRLAGISVPMGPQLVPALLLATHLRTHRRDLRIVLGGPALSLMTPADVATLLTSYPTIDAVVRFDGEQPLLALAEQARSGDWQPASVPGVSARTADGVRQTRPARGLHVNQLPAPRYPRQLIDQLASPVIGVTQARGCYWGKCDYCDFVELYDGSPPFRGRRPEVFVQELADIIAELGVRRFSFITESIPPAFARRMSALIAERGLDLKWTSFAMVDRRFDRETLAAMVESGCEFLVVGMETTITRVLNLVHKSADREENLRFLRDAQAVGMKLWVNLIPDLPSTTYEEALTALADVEELADCFFAISVFPFEATKSSNVGRDPERFGLRVLSSSDVVGQSEFALNHLHNSDPAMTEEQRREVHRRYREFAQRVAARTAAAQLAEDPRGRLEGPLTLALEDIDILDQGDRLVCTHMITRERITVPRAARTILAPYLDGKAFTVADLNGVPGARTVVDNLDRARMLARPVR